VATEADHAELRAAGAADWRTRCGTATCWPTAGISDLIHGQDPGDRRGRATASRILERLGGTRTVRYPGFHVSLPARPPRQGAPTSTYGQSSEGGDRGRPPPAAEQITPPTTFPCPASIAGPCASSEEVQAPARRHRTLTTAGRGPRPTGLRGPLVTRVHGPGPAAPAGAVMSVDGPASPAGLSTESDPAPAGSPAGGAERGVVPRDGQRLATNPCSCQARPRPAGHLAAVRRRRSGAALRRPAGASGAPFRGRQPDATGRTRSGLPRPRPAGSRGPTRAVTL